MSQTSENEWAEQFGVGGANLVWVEQIWSGCSKFGVGGANLEWVEWMWAEQCGE